MFVKGTIPTSFGSLTALTWLALRDCSLSGMSIRVHYFSSLSIIRLGSIPTSFGSLINLVTIKLRNNHISGIDVLCL